MATPGFDYLVAANKLAAGAYLFLENGNLGLTSPVAADQLAAGVFFR